MNRILCHFLTGTAVAVGLIASVSSTQATDYTEPDLIAPEVIVRSTAASGWYLRGDIGYDWSRIKRGKQGAVAGDNTRYGKLDGSFMVGAGVGNQITDYFRADLTADTMNRTRFSASSVLANTYVDIGNLNGYTPYIGAGIGGTYVKWEDSARMNGNEFHQGAANWRFTYALMAGVAVELNPTLKLDAGYRYRQVNGGKMFTSASDSGAAYDKSISIHDIRLGLRYQF